MRPASLTKRASSPSFCSVPGGRAGRLEDRLAHHRALHVVRAEVKRDLRHRHPHHDPVGLDVRHVVEHQAREGEHLQVVGAGRVAPAATLEDGVLRVERERDEREEAARAVLLLAEAQDVVDALLVRLDVAVEHRAVRRDPEPMRGVVHVEPDVRVLLPGRDERADAVGEDLGPAAGERPEPRLLELAQHLLVREPGKRRHVVDLRGRVALQVHVRQRRLERADRVDVEIEADVRVLAVHHVDLGEPGQAVLLDRVGHELLGRDRVRVLLLARRRERAELAFDAADVGLVEIEVLDEVDLVRAAAHSPRGVGQLAEREQVVRLEDREAVLEVEALAGLHLVPERRERGCRVEEGHVGQRSRSTTASTSASSSSRRTAPFRLARALLA